MAFRGDMKTLFTGVRSEARPYSPMPVAAKTRFTVRKEASLSLLLVVLLTPVLLAAVDDKYLA
jgi:hypothetical protein